MYQNSGTYKTFSKVKSSVIIELHVYHLLVMNELSVSSYIYNFLSKFPKKKKSELLKQLLTMHE